MFALIPIPGWNNDHLCFQHVRTCSLWRVGSLASHSTSFAKVMKLPPPVSFEKGKEGNFSGEQLFTRLWYRLISAGGFNVVQTITRNSVTFEYPLSLSLLSSSSAIELIKIYNSYSTTPLSRKKNLCGGGNFARVYGEYFKLNRN